MSDEPCPHCGGLKTTCDAILMKIEMQRILQHATLKEIEALFDALLAGKILLPENAHRIGLLKRERDIAIQDRNQFSELLKEALPHIGLSSNLGRRIRIAFGEFIPNKENTP